MNQDYKDFLNHLNQFQLELLRSNDLPGIALARQKLKQFIWKDLMGLSEDPEIVARKN